MHVAFRPARRLQDWWYRTPFVLLLVCSGPPPCPATHPSCTVSCASSVRTANGFRKMSHHYPMLHDGATATHPPHAPSPCPCCLVQSELGLIQRVLTDELMHTVLSHLGPYTLGQVACVCQQWRQFAEVGPGFWCVVQLARCRVPNRAWCVLEQQTTAEQSSRCLE